MTKFADDFPKETEKKKVQRQRNIVFKLKKKMTTNIEFYAQ